MARQRSVAAASCLRLVADCMLAKLYGVADLVSVSDGGRAEEKMGCGNGFRDRSLVLVVLGPPAGDDPVADTGDAGFLVLSSPGVDGGLTSPFLYSGVGGRMVSGRVGVLLLLLWLSLSEVFVDDDAHLCLILVTLEAILPMDCVEHEGLSGGLTLPASRTSRPGKPLAGGRGGVSGLRDSSAATLEPAMVSDEALLLVTADGTDDDEMKAVGLHGRLSLRSGSSLFLLAVCDGRFQSLGLGLGLGSGFGDAVCSDSGAAGRGLSCESRLSGSPPLGGGAGGMPSVAAVEEED